MNIYEYMENPLGKGATIPGKQFIIEDYNNRFFKLIENKKIEVKIFTTGNTYYYHFIMPTESDKRDNTYDIIIKLHSDNKLSLVDKSVANYDVAFFSNCPSFTYSYAYAYNMNGLFITELSKLYDDIILKKPPVSRNPGIITNYEKSIFFACKYIIDNKEFLDKSYIKSNSIKLPRDYFKKHIRTNARVEFEIKQSNARFKADNDNKSKSHEPRKARDYGNKRIQSNVSAVNKIAPRKSTGSSTVRKISKIKPKKR